MKRIVLVLLCLILSFAGCGKGGKVDTSSAVLSDSTTASSTGESSSNFSDSLLNTNQSVSGTNTSSLPSETAPNFVDNISSYGDLLAQMGDCGKTALALGDLGAAQYSEAVSTLSAVLSSYGGTVSLVAYSLDGQKALGYNTAADLFCACTIKAPYTLYCCKQMEQGIGSLDTPLTYESKHYEPGTGDMQYSAVGTVFSMQTTLKKSMEISDNVGYNMAVDYFGRDGYNNFVSSFGCPSLQIKPTVWSLHAKARELAIAWREIYNYFKTDTTYAKFLYEISTNTGNNYATEALGDINYSHKQGHNRSGKWHAYSDAGIVWGDSPYIIVILTDSPGPTTSAKQTIADAIKIIDNQLF